MRWAEGCLRRGTERAAAPGSRSTESCRQVWSPGGLDAAALGVAGQRSGLWELRVERR